MTDSKHPETDQSGLKAMFDAAPPADPAPDHHVDVSQAFAEWLNSGPDIAKAAGIEIEVSAITSQGGTLKLTSAGFPEAAPVDQMDGDLYPAALDTIGDLRAELTDARAELVRLQDDLNQAHRRNSELSQTPPVDRLRVKPLEWGKLGPGFYRAKAPLFGNIRIEKYGPKYTTCYSVPGYSNVFADGEFATAEEAKAAAEAEYQKRMTAALSAPATEVEHG